MSSKKIDVTESLTVAKFEEFNVERKDAVYKALLEFIPIIEEVPKKSLRKTLHLALAVMAYKGAQLDALEQQWVPSESSSGTENNENALRNLKHAMEENVELKIMLSDEEAQNKKLCKRLRELNDKYHELSKELKKLKMEQNLMTSDVESSDPLSELDKQEYLLQDINTKNKHIQSLLKEMEVLQNQQIINSKTIAQLENDLGEEKAVLNRYQNDISELKYERNQLIGKLQNCQLDIKRLEAENEQLQEERTDKQNELKVFISKLIERAEQWKHSIGEKNREIKALYNKTKANQDFNTDKHHEIIKETNEAPNTGDKQTTNYIEAFLTKGIYIRDRLIDELEARIKSMADEMVKSTEIMNKISVEREDMRDPTKSRPCCQAIELALKSSQQRCEELSQLLEKTENECYLKSKEALEATKTLAVFIRSKRSGGEESSAGKRSQNESEIKSRSSESDGKDRKEESSAGKRSQNESEIKSRSSVIGSINASGSKTSIGSKNTSGGKNASGILSNNISAVHHGIGYQISDYGNFELTDIGMELKSGNSSENISEKDYGNNISRGGSRLISRAGSKKLSGSVNSRSKTEGSKCSSKVGVAMEVGEIEIGSITPSESDEMSIKESGNTAAKTFSLTRDKTGRRIASKTQSEKGSEQKQSSRYINSTGSRIVTEMESGNISKFDQLFDDEDAILPALGTCAVLERKLLAREQQIKSLVAEVNRSKELAEENLMLRKQLNVDVNEKLPIVKNPLVTKMRRKNKLLEKLACKYSNINDRLKETQVYNKELRDEIIELQDALNEALGQLKQLRLQYYKQQGIQEQLKQLQQLQPTFQLPMDVIQEQQQLLQAKRECESSNYKEMATERSSSGKMSVKRVKWLYSPEHRDMAQQMTPRMELGEIEGTFKDKFPHVVNVCLRCERRTARLLDEKNGPSAEQQYLTEQNKCLRNGMKEILQRLQEFNNKSSHHDIINDKLLRRILDALNKPQVVKVELNEESPRFSVASQKTNKSHEFDKKSNISQKSISNKIDRSSINDSIDYRSTSNDERKDDDNIIGNDDDDVGNNMDNGYDVENNNEDMDNRSINDIENDNDDDDLDNSYDIGNDEVSITDDIALDDEHDSDDVNMDDDDEEVELENDQNNCNDDDKEEEEVDNNQNKNGNDGIDTYSDRDYPDEMLEQLRANSQIIQNTLDEIELKFSPNKFDSSTRPTTPIEQRCLPDYICLPEITDSFLSSPIKIINNNKSKKKNSKCLQKQSAKSMKKSTKQDDHRLLCMELEELKIYRKLYEDLQSKMNCSEKKFVKSYAKLNENYRRLKIDSMKNEVQLKYVQMDFNIKSNELNRYRIKAINQMTELKQEIIKKSVLNNELHDRLLQMQQEYRYNEEEYNSIQKLQRKSMNKLAQITDQLIQKTIGEEALDNEGDPPNHLDFVYGIVDDVEELQFITIDEYNERDHELQILRNERLQYTSQINELQNLLIVAQKEIDSQQRLLKDITENHTNLRYLMTDLDNPTEYQLLMNKMQHDITNSKIEMEHLENDYADLKDRYLILQEELNVSNDRYQQLFESSAKERQHQDIKLRFLQKSLLLLKDKYAKYTPLISLTDFILAYKNHRQQYKLFRSYLYKNQKNKYSYYSARTLDDISDVDIVQLIDESVRKLQEEKLLLDGTEITNQQKIQQQRIIKLIKMETQCKLYEEEIRNLEKKCSDFEMNLNELRYDQAMESEHWQTLEAIFGGIDNDDRLQQLQVKSRQNLKLIGTKLSAMVAATAEVGCNTDHNSHNPETLLKSQDKSTETLQSVNNEHGDPNSNLYSLLETTCAKCIIKDNQLNELQKDVDRLLKEILENEKSIHLREDYIKDLEIKLKLSEKSGDSTNAVALSVQQQQQTDIIEKTILSFHTLLSEKDRSLQKCQEMKQIDREEYNLEKNKFTKEVETLNETIVTLNKNLTEKDFIIENLQRKYELEMEKNDKFQKALFANNSNDHSININKKDSVSNSAIASNEISDETIEEMYQQQEIHQDFALINGGNNNELMIATSVREKHELEIIKTIPIGKEMKVLQMELTKANDQIKFYEEKANTEHNENTILKNRIKLLEEEKGNTEHQHQSEMEQIKRLLNEKEDHINELMDTLNSFHDDHKRYINDSSHFTADQIAKLASDVTRLEAINRVYRTEVEALKKQLNTLMQREKQTRDLNNALRNQLIKRPVVSVKSEYNSRVKNEALQKRIQQLETQLIEAKNEIEKQNVVIETKRNRNAQEIALWEKQKRWQQNAEKLKIKLDESETNMEKMKSLLQTSKNTISRLEKDKQVLENKLRKVDQRNQSSNCNMKCCRAPSCPNLQHSNGELNVEPRNRRRNVSAICSRSNNSTTAPGGQLVKYTSSESPETYTTGGGSSESSGSPVQMLYSTDQPHHSHHHPQQNNLCRQHYHTIHHPSSSNDDEIDTEVVDNLKLRIEMQQRRIQALELASKGNNYLTTELERLQEKLSSVEAQNIRLEANNIQLQLDNDLLRQGDGNERLQKRNKHLEEYIIALKEEIASTEARRRLCKCNGIILNTQNGQSAEQTILSLRNLVDKLKTENKYLKDSAGNDGTNRRNNTHSNYNITETNIIRLRQLYSESLAKIDSLQLALNNRNQYKCPICNNNIVDKATKINTEYNDDLTYVREQLQKKSQLLQKAKVLLTRAAAKEKVLKEHLYIWKRKCSELQNVPIIDEISE